MVKMNLQLRRFLTLAGPAQIIEVTGEENEILYFGKNAKIRDCEELLDREVKHIEPVMDKDRDKIPVFKIWIY